MEKNWYIITKDGKYIGLFNYGRTYMVAKYKTTVKATEEAARIIARKFNATIQEA